jgi:hypothetical protein
MNTRTQVLNTNSSGTARVTASLFALNRFKYNSVYNQHFLITHTPYIRLLIPIAN